MVMAMVTEMEAKSWGKFVNGLECTMSVGDGFSVLRIGGP